MDIRAISPTAFAGAAAVDYKPQTDTDYQSTSTDFSSALKEAMEGELTHQALTVGGADAYSSALNSGVEDIMSLIISSSASGDIGQAEMALFMLCGMMQSMGGGDSEMSVMLMSVMASLFQSLGSGIAEETRKKIMNASYDPSVLDAVDKGVFGNDYEDYFSNPDKSTAGEAVLPAEAWRPTMPAITSDASDRSAEKLNAVIDQFAVEASERYRPYRRGNDTYCNIFVWDVTSALGAEIPHFVDINTGEPRSWPDITGAYELDANGIQTWLNEYGQQYGWREATAREAQEWANSGRPAITSWYNAGGIGHVQAVRPSKDGSYDPVSGVTVAQAGASRYNYGYASQSFGSSRMPSVRYYIHD